MAFRAGDVVLVPFPYRDRLAERARPAVVVSADAYNQHGDVVVAAITSHRTAGCDGLRITGLGGCRPQAPVDRPDAAGDGRQCTYPVARGPPDGARLDSSPSATP